jgi:glutamyl-tRNA reductase
LGLTVVGISHRTAPVEIRERVAVRAVDALRTAIEARDLTDSGEAVVLSTCNRTEFYFAAGVEHAAEVTRLVSLRAGVDVGAQLYLRRDRDAVMHLFAVASGIESMIFGEAQIQGQVKQAVEQCRDASGVALTRLFHSAGACASRVRTETGVARGAGSVSSAAVQLARKIFGSLVGRRAMVLGAGDVAELALECLAADGMNVGIVANRTHARARELAARYDARAMHYDECWDELRSVDVLVCSTAAPRTIVHADHVAPAVRRRAGAPLCVLDLALPRDVSPEVGHLENVFLYDLDDLQAAANTVVESRREELPAAEAIIAAEAERYWQWLAGLEAVPVLVRVRDEVERMRLTELARADRHFGPLSDSQRETLEQFSRALMNRFLHSPSVRLREAAGNGRGLGVVDAARYLFGVEESGADKHDDGMTGTGPATAGPVHADTNRGENH